VQRVRGAAASQAALLSAAAATAEAASTRKKKKKRPQSAPGQKRGSSSKSSNGGGRRKNNTTTTSPPSSPFERFDTTDTEERPLVGMREFIDRVRNLRRNNIVNHTLSLSTQAEKEKIELEVRSKHQSELIALKRSLASVERHNSDLQEQCHELDSRLSTSTEETSSLSFNVTMLRKRLQLLTAREVENQRRLETFTRFAPLFDALDAYSSPADALRRLSVLEKESGSTFAEARQAEETLKDVQDEYAKKFKHQEMMNAELNVKLLESEKHANIEIARLENELHTAKQDARSLESFREKYLRTQTSVRDCYQRALTAAAVLDVGDPRIAMASESNVADIGHPLQMLEHLGLLFEASNPTKASMRVHMLTGTINRMWLDLTGQQVGAAGSSSKVVDDDQEDDQKRTEGKSGDVVAMAGAGFASSSTPDKLLFKPEDILKMVGQKIQAVKIREKNTSAKLENTQVRCSDYQGELVSADKVNRKLEIELIRLQKLLKK